MKLLNKRTIILIACLPTMLHAQILKTNIYQGVFQPQSMQALQQMQIDHPVYYNHAEFYGNYSPERQYSNGGVVIRAATKAPSGSTKQYVDTTAYGGFEYEIVNQNSDPVTCIVTRMVCLEQYQCINVQDTILIPRKNGVRDRGSRVYQTWKYMGYGQKYTSATIFFEGCSDNSNTKKDTGMMAVSK